jgi:hypothetical protein
MHGNILRLQPKLALGQRIYHPSLVRMPIDTLILFGWAVFEPLLCCALELLHF